MYLRKWFQSSLQNRRVVIFRRHRTVLTLPRDGPVTDEILEFGLDFGWNVYDRVLSHQNRRRQSETSNREHDASPEEKGRLHGQVTPPLCHMCTAVAAA